MNPGRRGGTDDGTPVPDADAERVLLLLEGADRDLVATELGIDHRVIPATDGVPEAAFDVAVVDARGLDAHGATLADRVEASGTFLPVLCLLPPGADPPPGLWDRADDVATRPLSRRELRARVASLLRARRLSVDLDRRNERLERVAEVLAHDVRNPLAVASGYVDRAMATGDVGELDPAADALARADRLVDDVLALARHGPADLNVRAVDVATVARSAWDAVETGAATLDVGDPGEVGADEGRLRELFENLFRNCVEHGSTGSRAGPDGSVEHGSTGNRPAAGDGVERGTVGGGTADDAVTVSVGTLDDGRGFYVADDGPGIPADERDEVFEWGYTTRSDGTGFGLAIVEHIAGLHGWTVSAASADSGARFEIRPD
ncbi:MAG: sensor histidine kinase [Haloferacaceae archaeon]